MHAAFAANAREPRSAKRRSQITQEPAIHPSNAHPHLLRDAMAALQITGPDRRRESVLRVICHGDGFLFRIKRSDVAYWPKDFFLHAPRRFRKASIDGWLHVEPAVAIVTKCRNSSASYNRRSFLPSQSIVGEHLLSMLRRNQRT